MPLCDLGCVIWIRSAAAMSSFVSVTRGTILLVCVQEVKVAIIPMPWNVLSPSSVLEL